MCLEMYCRHSNRFVVVLMHIFMHYVQVAAHVPGCYFGGMSNCSFYTFSTKLDIIVITCY